MNIIKNMKISRSIMMTALLPTVLALFFSFQLVMKEVNVSSELKKLETLTTLSIKMSSLVHEQQKERGATAVFLGSKGTKFSSEMRAQRAETNKKRSELKSYISSFDVKDYDTGFNGRFNSVNSTLSKMDSIRASIDSLSITAKDAIGYYTGLNNQNLDLISYMAFLSPDPAIVVSIVGYTNFLQGKERAGIERAVGANGFSSGRFSQQAMDKFKGLISMQDTYNKVFLSYATETQTTIYNEVMNGTAAQEVNRMRKIALAGGVSGALQGVEGKQWFDTITRKINGLKKIETSLSGDLEAQMTATEHAAGKRMMLSIAIAAIALAVTIALSLTIIRILTGSFSHIVASMTSLAEGNLEAEIPEHTNNEIGEMVNALKIFKENGLETEHLKKEQEEAEKRAAKEKQQAMMDIADDFENQVGAIISSISESSKGMEGTAKSLSSLAELANERASAVAAASEEATANVSTVASATEEMSTSIAEIAQEVNKSNKIAADALQKAKTTNRTVEKLHEAAKEIDSVINIINDIAAQTNLLALNATIEAARAGDAGKGFAVVASEVKDLAGQTAKSTEQIQLQISSIQAITTEAVEAIGAIQETVEEISTVSNTIAAAIEEQSTTTADIAKNVQEASQGTAEVSTNIVEVTRATSETGTSSAEVLEAANSLTSQSEELQTAVGQFLLNVRAA